MAFIVTSGTSKYTCDTVVAPTGWYRDGNGKMIRDGAPSPEMGERKNAYRFRTHRSAARVAGTLGGSGKIIEVK